MVKIYGWGSPKTEYDQHGSSHLDYFVHLGISTMLCIGQHSLLIQLVKIENQVH